MSFLQNIFNDISLTKNISVWNDDEDSDKANLRRIKLLSSYSICSFQQFLDQSKSSGRKNDVLSNALLEKSKRSEKDLQLKLIQQALGFAPPGSNLDSVFRFRASKWFERHMFEYALFDLCEIQSKNKKDLENIQLLQDKCECSEKKKTKKTTIETQINFHKFLRNFSSSVNLGSSKKGGRFLVAGKNINPGELIADENSYAALLDRRYRETHCEFCLIKSEYLIPCLGCASVYFCSVKCRAAATFHSSECLLMDQIFKADTGVWHLALRIVSGKPASYWATKPYLEKLNSYSSNAISTVYNLVTHKDSGDIEAPVLMKEALTALFYLRVLKTSGYFKNEDSSSNELSSVEIEVGILLLHFMRVTFFNSHEVTELIGENVEKIGCCLNPSLALINHSCDPNYARVMTGRRSLAFATRLIRKDEEISDVYSPTFFMVDRITRHDTTQRYNFICECKPCIEGWKTEQKMSLNFIPLNPGDNIDQLEKDIKLMLSENWSQSLSLNAAIEEISKTLKDSHLRIEHPCKGVLQLENLLHRLLWKFHCS